MKKNNISKYFVFVLFVFPALAFVVFATDIPFLMNLYYSFYDWNGIGQGMKFVGLQNFKTIFTNDSLFWRGAIFTLKFAVFYVVIWKFIFGPGFEALYHLTGWEFFDWSWLGTSKLAFYVVVIMTVWQNVGFYMVNYIAGIIAVPKELIEAAKIDGANSIQVLGKITIPMIMPAISICMLMSLTFAFKLFDVIMVFTKGGPANSTITVAYNIYKEAFANSRYGLATAKSLVFVIFVLIVTAVQLKVTKNKEVEA